MDIYTEISHRYYLLWTDPSIEPHHLWIKLKPSDSTYRTLVKNWVSCEELKKHILLFLIRAELVGKSQ